MFASLFPWGQLRYNGNVVMRANASGEAEGALSLFTRDQEVLTQSVLDKESQGEAEIPIHYISSYTELPLCDVVPFHPMRLSHREDLIRPWTQAG